MKIPLTKIYFKKSKKSMDIILIWTKLIWGIESQIIEKVKVVKILVHQIK